MLEDGQSAIYAHNAVMQMRAGNKRDLFMQSPKVREFIDAEYAARIEQHVEELRAKHDPQRIRDAEAQREIDRQIAEGRTMPPEEVEQRSVPERSEDADVSQIDEDVASLRRELKVEEPKKGGETGA